MSLIDLRSFFVCTKIGLHTSKAGTLPLESHLQSDLRSFRCTPLMFSDNIVTNGWSLKALPSEHFRYLCLCKRRIQVRYENAVKFIESEGKLPQEKAVVGPSQVG
jgi:hypothetical protein